MRQFKSRGMRLTALAVSTAILCSCNIQPREKPEIPFHRMNAFQLNEYNKGRPFDQMIICRKEARSSTYIRKTRCDTVERMLGSQSDLSKLGVLHQTSTYSPFRRRD